MTRPASSSLDAFGAMNIASQATHSKSHCFDGVAIDGVANIRFLAIGLNTPLVTYV